MLFYVGIIQQQKDYHKKTFRTKAFCAACNPPIWPPGVSKVLLFESVKVIQRNTQVRLLSLHYVISYTVWCNKSINSLESGHFSWKSPVLWQRPPPSCVGGAVGGSSSIVHAAAARFLPVSAQLGGRRSHITAAWRGGFRAHSQIQDGFWKPGDERRCWTRHGGETRSENMEQVFIGAGVWIICRDLKDHF